MALAALPCAAAEIPLDQRRSAYDDMSRDNKAMQDDDTSNPAMLSVLDGEALWNAKAGELGKSCADCHGDAKTAMKGVAARYPAWSESAGVPVDLEQRINISREKNQQAKPFPYESKDMLAISAYVAMQSRGEPIARYDDPRLSPFHRAAAAPRSIGAKGSSTSPARNATTTTGASISPATSSPRVTRPAIRSIGWNGRASAHCSGACAIA